MDGWTDGRTDLVWIQVLPSGDLGQPQSRQTSEALPVFQVWVRGVVMAENRLASVPKSIAHCCDPGVLVHGWQCVGWEGLGWLVVVPAWGRPVNSVREGAQTGS